MNVSWFHCGRCGTLFQSAAGDVEDRLCTSCGLKPSLGMEASPAEPSMPSATLPASPIPAAKSKDGERERHVSRRRKHSYFMVKLVAGWLLVLGLIIFGARKLWPEKQEVANLPPQAETTRQQTVEQANFVEQARQPSANALRNFLLAESPEAKNQFVFSPVTTTSRMSRFYGITTPEKVDPAQLTLRQIVALDLPGREAVESQWSRGEDGPMEAVFIRENGEWRIDWDHFVRYSEIPWSLFLAGSGDVHGEFRLLARERLAEERKNSESISMILYAPRFGKPSETGFASPEFLVPRDSKNGRMLEEAFNLERSHKRVFGVNLKSVDPEGFIRLRVKVKRLEQEGGRKFVIEDIVACHWYSSDEPGVDTGVQLPEN